MLNRIKLIAELPSSRGSRGSFRPHGVDTAQKRKMPWVAASVRDDHLLTKYNGRSTRVSRLGKKRWALTQK